MATLAPAPAPSAPAAPAVPPPSYMTFEGWISLLVVVLGALPTTLLKGSSSETLQIVGIITSAISALVLHTNVTSLKKAHLALVANATKPPSAAPGIVRPGLLLIFALGAITAVAALSQPSCATLKTMTGDFATCAEADLGQMVQPSTDPNNPLAGLLPASLESFVVEIVTLNWPALEAQLTAVAAIVGTAAVKCAIAAIDAVVNAPQPSGSGSGSGSAAPTARAAPPAGLARAKAWAAAH